MIQPRRRRADSSRYAYFFIAICLVTLVAFLISGSRTLQGVERTRVSFDRLLSDWYLMHAALDHVGETPTTRDEVGHGLEAYQRFDGNLSSLIKSPALATGVLLSAPLRTTIEAIEESWGVLGQLYAQTPSDTSLSQDEREQIDDLSRRFEVLIVSARGPLDDLVADQVRAQEVVLWCLGATVLLIISIFLLVESEANKMRRSAVMAENLTRATIATQEQERANIARSLHDSLSQEISLAAMELALYERKSGQDRDQVSHPDALKTTKDRLDRAVDWIRDLAHELRPVELDEMGLSEAIGAYCDDTSRSSGISIRCRAETGMIGLSRDAGINVYRIVQEAVKNAVRHAEAHSVRVLLSERAGDLVVQIDDDGRGMEGSSRLSMGRGIGLVTMRERATIAGGDLSISSRPGEGTSISLVIPNTSDNRKDR